MFLNAQIAKDGAGDGAQRFVNGTGSVLPVPFSHNKNAVGVHWLRISFDKKHLGCLSEWLSKIWGNFDADGFGLWSYDSRLAWHSGVTLNFDHDEDRSRRVHLGRMTLDCPGSSLDEMTAPDLQLLIEFASAIDGKCTRIDVYFDDYARLVCPRDLHEVIECGDYSGSRHAARRDKWESGRCIRDEVSFGERGSHGNGKYLRFYDKFLESSGKENCCRWEVEFSQGKADTVFKKIAAACGDLDSFAALCGSLVAGSVTFVHRDGDKNISRLERYDWWEKILAILGDIVIVRTRRVKDSLTGKISWLERNVAPTLACLRKVFFSDRAFFRWLYDVCDDGSGRMNPYTEQIADRYEKTIYYNWGEMSRQEDRDYELSKM